MLTEPGTGKLLSSNAAAIASALWDSADFPGAESSYQRALKEQPSDVEALHGLGRMRLAQNDLAGALLLLERGESLSLSLAGGGRDELTQRIRRDLAWALYRLERFDLASEQFARLPGQEALARQCAALAGTPAYRLTSVGGEISMPFLGTDPLPIITLTIGGREHAFVLDTGSGQLVIDRSIARELDLPNFGSRDVIFASGQSAPISHTIIPDVTMGEATLSAVPAEVMDIRRFAPQVSGFIGTSLLWRFHVLFDFDGQVLRLRPAGEPFFEVEGFAQAPFMLFDDHLLLAPARVNQHTTMAYIASGMAGGAFTVPESTVRQAALSEVGTTLEGVGAGGAVAIRPVRADTLSIGEWQRANLEGFGGFFPQELEWRYGFRVGALLSHSFLMRNRWAIDFTRMNFYFD